MSSIAKMHPTNTPPAGYIFGDSGLPQDLQYLNDISVTAAGDRPYFCGVDTGRGEYGRIALSSVGLANQFTISCPLSSNAGTAQMDVNQMRFARRTAGASALIVFVKDSAGNTLSGSITLGPVL
jgi:hypothetical protein